MTKKWEKNNVKIESGAGGMLTILKKTKTKNIFSSQIKIALVYLWFQKETMQKNLEN